MLPLQLLAGWVCLLSVVNAQRAKEQCALIKSTTSEVYSSGQPAYIELAPMSVGRDFTLEMMVQLSAYQTNGNLFAIGSQREYPYYVYAGWFVAAKFLVLEVTTESVRLTIKSSGGRNTDYLEVMHTYPVPYELYDGDFHHIVVRRTQSAWHLSVDGTSASKPVSNFDVQLQDKPAFIGGRPGYTSFQVRGVIKNVNINGALVSFNGLDLSGRIQITRCGSRTYTKFESQMARARVALENYNENIVYEDDDDDEDEPHRPSSDNSMTSMFGHEASNPNTGYAVLPGIFR